MRETSIFALVVLLLIGCYYPRGQRREVVQIEKEIQVRVRLSVPEGRVKITAAKQMKLEVGKQQLTFEPQEWIEFVSKVSGYDIVTARKTWYLVRDTSRLQCGGFIQVGEQIYRGDINIFWLPETGLVVVNSLGLDEYLYSVVPGEIGPISGETYEAVKAQAVAARSFTIARLGQRSGLGYDLYDSYLRDQEYRGASVELPLARRAVDETRGEVLTYQGQVAEALYHGNCGGVTADGGREYLRGVHDTPAHRLNATPFCSWSKNFSWEVSVGLDSLERTIARLKGGSDRFRVKGVRMERDSRSGRVKMLNFQTDRGTIVVSSNDFRFGLGLKSTGFDIRISGCRFVIKGKGWGHGVGFCQDGAIGMARKGYKYHEILKHYYPLLEIREIY